MILLTEIKGGLDIENCMFKRISLNWTGPGRLLRSSNTGGREKERGERGRAGQDISSC